MTLHFLTRSRSVILSAILIALAVSCAPMFVHAQTDSEPIRTEIVIPSSGVERAADQAAGTVRDLGEYIGSIYNFLISIVGLVAAVMMIIGGFQYLTAGGDKSRVDAGKKRITNALIGLILAFSSYAILNTINPALLTLKLPGVSNVKTELSFLPWCEDIAKSGASVTVLVRDPGITYHGCGMFGAYPQGKSEAYCVYRGDGVANDCINEEVGDGETHVNPVPTVCFPDPDITNEYVAKVATYIRQITVEEFRKMTRAEKAQYKTAAGVTKVSGAECNSCAGMAYFYSKAHAGKPVPPELCTAFQAIANRGSFDSTAFGRVSAFGQPYVQYCAFDGDINTCVGSAIFCRNPPPTTAGCYDGYNKDPNFLFAYQSLAGGGRGVKSWSYDPGIATDQRNSNIGGHPEHLANVCFANPCNYNSARGGCKDQGGAWGTFDKVSNYVISGIGGISNCDNVGD